MPQIVPVSDFRSDITSVSQYTDLGEVVVLTQNGRPRWAMVDFADWNTAAQERERAYARALREVEDNEAAGVSRPISSDDFERRIRERRATRLGSE